MKVHTGESISLRVMRAIARISEARQSEWVPAISVISAVADSVPPELAVRKWLGGNNPHRRRFHRTVTGIVGDHRVENDLAEARAYYVKSTIRALKGRGAVEYRKAANAPRSRMRWDSREIRLTERGREHLRKAISSAE